MAYNNKSTAEDRAIEKFSDLLIARVKDIQADWEKPWISPNSAFPKNIYGRPYSGSNALMLMLHAEKEGYELPVYATFERIMSLNLGKDGKPLADQPRVCVQKGEKSFPVFLTTFTVINKETKEKIKYDDFKKLSEEEKDKYDVYPKQQVFNVFNLAAQTNIKEARPDMYAKLVADNTPKLPESNGYSFKPVDVAIEKKLWFCPVHLEQSDQAYYRPSDNTIHLPMPEQFKKGEDFVGTFLHESTHERQKALGLLKEGAFASDGYTYNELAAEMSAALICQRIGASKTIKQESLSYIKSWLDNINESPNYLKNVLTDVKRESTQIMQRIDIIQDRLDRNLPLNSVADLGIEDHSIKVELGEAPTVAAQATPHRSR